MLTAFFAITGRAQIERSQQPGAFGIALESPMRHLLVAMAVAAVIVAAALYGRRGA
ncbi:MAG: hypothetical protein OEO77_03560 [Acidimicrobiia bacterium]|nr:hypothetical protein [Acidimicrobiia bacterium]